MRSGLPLNKIARQKSVESDGFTVVETLIFLAVSSALLISAVAMFRGPQNSTQFTQAMDDINQNINSIINNVANGYYPRINNVICNATTTPVTVDEDPDVDSETGRGTDDDCIFLGRIIQFKTDEDYFDVYSIIGAREISNKEVTDLVEARPSYINSPDRIALKNGVQIKNMKVVGGSNSGFLAFLSSFGKYDGDQLRSGSLATDFSLVPGKGLSGVTIDDAIAELISGSIYANSKNPVNGIELCFQGGGADQFGRITVGGRSSSASTTVNISKVACS